MSKCRNGAGNTTKVDNLLVFVNGSTTVHKPVHVKMK